jgi:NAD(P)-dependent dehydrogenase (short-subunit alcohol dehydrogenase family)
MTAGTRAAIVTGGGRGIGRAVVERLIAADHHVLVIDVNEKGIASLAELEQSTPGMVTGVLGSTLDRLLVEQAVGELVARCGRLDAVVNNAGLTLPATFLDQTDDDWDRIVDSNLKGAFVVSQVAARHMVERRRGAFVNISSISAHGVRTGPPAYAAAKSGIEGLSRLMAVQLGEHGIRVNSLVVGTTATPWLLGRKTDDELATMRATTLLDRLAEPDDIAAAITFLVSDEARHITGQLLSVSGGQWLA